MNSIFSLRGLAPPVLAVFLGGCAGTGDHGANTSSPAAQSALKYDTDQANDIGPRVDALLRQPLSANDAVAIALMNHHGHFASSCATSGTRAVLHTMSETRKAYYRSIAATQSVHSLTQVKQAADIATDLTARMAKRGNLAALDAMREQVFYLDTSAQLMRAQMQANQEREHLLRQLGLAHSHDKLQLPQHLPDLPEQAAPRDPHADASRDYQVAYAAYGHAFALAWLYQNEIVPLHKRISEENLLRYNGMLISVFALLADTRAQANAVNAAIKAALEFWIADSDVQLAAPDPAIERQLYTEGKTDD